MNKIAAFLTIGDPDKKTSVEIAKCIQKSGADLLILNLPFSDPTAESPLVISSNERALKNIKNADDIFDTVFEIRKDVDIPILFMTYANIIFVYGAEKFAKKSAELKIDGIIIPDLPYEERDEFAEEFEKNGVDFVYMIAPNSKKRIENLAKNSKKFAYCINTGNKDDIKMIYQTAKNISADLNCIFEYNSENQKDLEEFSDTLLLKQEVADIIEKYQKNSPIYIGELIRKFR